MSIKWALHHNEEDLIIMLIEEITLDESDKLLYIWSYDWQVGSMSSIFML